MLMKLIKKPVIFCCMIRERLIVQHVLKVSMFCILNNYLMALINSIKHLLYDGSGGVTCVSSVLVLGQ